MKKHANIPVFVPHVGCPNNCIFCNQRKISGHRDFDIENVKGEIENALATMGNIKPQIAFFGGSFTGIERGLMISLLEIANEYIKADRASSIRLSTRPDYISDEILDILEKYNVKNIELGVQSTDQKVLDLNRRGHSVEDTVNAFELIKKRDIDISGQMMIGLYGATPESETETAKAIVSLGATEARIYPTVTFADTELAEICKSGLYTPISLDEAIERSANVLEIFHGAGVNVIRIGLCANEGLKSDDVVAGAYHEAMGEMIWSKYNYRRMRKAILDLKPSGETVFKINMNDLSKFIGQKKENVIALEKEFNIRIKFDKDKGYELD